MDDDVQPDPTPTGPPLPPWFWRAMLQSALTAVLILAGLFVYDQHQQHTVDHRREDCQHRNEENALASAMRGEPPGMFQPENCW